MALSTVLVIAAVICFVLAAAGATVPRVNLVALGLALWAGSTLV